MQEHCQLCDGTGLRVVTEANGTRYAQGCDCQLSARTERMLSRSGIPARFRGKTLESYKTEGRHRSIFAAHLLVRRFVDQYPYAMDGLGLVLVGTSGLGKTHLAAAILQALIVEKRVDGLYYDYQELLKKIQNSYNASVSTTELGLLRPVFEAEVLVLDDLGAAKPTDWVWDTVSHVLNSRYNRNRTTIITTNFANLPPSARAERATAASATQAAVRGETLGDRIGERMRSRLHEMCVFVEMEGEDRRQAENLAQFEAF